MIATLLLYCRAGFDQECAAEVRASVPPLGANGHAESTPDSAYVTFHPHDPASARLLIAGLRFKQLDRDRDEVTGQLRVVKVR